MQLEPQSQYVKSSTYPKCPICNIQWYQQINDGKTEIICAGCNTIWIPKGTECQDE